ncbi:MAG: ThuA domain-containing protein [Planctomycetota bacterium]
MIARRVLVAAVAFLALCVGAASAQQKALIIDGQNNHADWPKITVMMKRYLEETGLFEVDVARTQFTWRGAKQAEFLPLADAGPSTDLPQPKTDPDFKPDFSQYDVVISNFGNQAAPWPKETQIAFEEYVRTGGGFVPVHAANNAFGDWPEYNQMIGVGGWGGRKPDFGVHLYYDDAGELVRDETHRGGTGSHGAKHSFPIIVRTPEHPIVAGLPQQWLCWPDECYARLRGPAENVTVLATGKDQSDRAPTDVHEPMLMTIKYGEGRVFHTMLGDNANACEGVGFIVTFTRGVEWAATGEVTIPVPDDFSTATEAKSRPFRLTSSDE